MRVVTNVSTKKYHKGQERLIQTLKKHCKQDVITFDSEKQVHAKYHKQSMYGFKPKAFLKLHKMGYTSILWLDASMYVIKGLTPIFKEIEKTGYFFQDSGWVNSDFTPDNVKQYMGTDKGKMISSGVVGLDLNNELAMEFLKRWDKASEDGMFNGSYENHRHDQTLASLIIEDMKLKITPNNTFWQYGKPEEKPLHKNILILANGIV